MKDNSCKRRQKKISAQKKIGTIKAIGGCTKDVKITKTFTMKISKYQFS